MPGTECRCISIRNRTLCIWRKAIQETHCMFHLLIVQKCLIEISNRRWFHSYFDIAHSTRLRGSLWNTIFAHLRNHKIGIINGHLFDNRYRFSISISNSTGKVTEPQLSRNSQQVSSDLGEGAKTKSVCSVQIWTHENHIATKKHDEHD